MDSKTLPFFTTLHPQGATMSLTFNKGPEFTDYQFEYSHQMCSRMYYFQGAPDMIFTYDTQKQIDLTVSSDSDSSIVDVWTHRSWMSSYSH